MNKMFVLVFALAALSSCKPLMELPTKVNEISYYKDKRTGVCFATVCSPTYGGYFTISITEVACTDSVMRLIENK